MNTRSDAPVLLVSIPHGTPKTDIRWRVFKAAAGATRRMRRANARVVLASDDPLVTEAQRELAELVLADRDPMSLRLAEVQS